MKPNPPLRQVPLIVRPKVENQVDWSRERIVLVRRGDKELWWMKSGKYWSGRGNSSTAATELRLVRVNCRPESSSLVNCSQLSEGGRLSQGLIKEHAQEIDDFFGFPVSEHISTKKEFTIVIS